MHSIPAQSALGLALARLLREPQADQPEVASSAESRLLNSEGNVSAAPTLSANSGSDTPTPFARETTEEAQQSTLTESPLSAAPRRDSESELPSEICFIPQALTLQLPGHFRLAAASATLSGVDLPRLLPRACATPGHDTLLSVLDDCEDACAAIAALRHGSSGQAATATSQFNDVGGVLACLHADGSIAPRRTASDVADSAHEQEQLRRIVRWAIKRALRGAGELVQEQAHAHSRDLFWCCELTSTHAAPVLGDLAAQQPHAMAMHVQQTMRNALAEAFDEMVLVKSPPMSEQLAADTKRLLQFESNSRQDYEWDALAGSLAACLWCLLNVYINAHAMSPADLQRTVHCAWHVARALDAAALFKLTAVPTNWLGEPYTASAQLRACVRRPVAARKRRRRALQLPPLLTKRAKQAGEAAREAVLQTVARAVAFSEMLHAGLGGAPPPLHNISCCRQLTEFDCRAAAGRADAAAHFAMLAADPLLLASAPPVVLRGGCAAWPAAGGGGGDGWSADTLVAAAGFARGRVRLAPSPAFPFVQPRIAAAVAEICGEAALPSTTREVRTT